MKLDRILLPLLLAGVLAGGAAAQDKPTPPPPATDSNPAPYLLAGDDTIAINVVNFQNLSSTVVIPPDGKITVPLLEPILVLGKTTSEVAQILSDKWRTFVINPSVTVTLTSKRRENVLMYGFLGHPGTLEYKPQMHILEALASAGGPITSSDLTKVVVTRKSGTKQFIDLSKPETRGGTEADIVLQPGDVIYIPERRLEFSVIGEVIRPGSFDYRDDMTVLDALTMVGNTKETADLNASTLVSDGKEQKLDLDALLRRGDLSVNIKLKPGDRIMVPEVKNRVYVFGAVGKPGYYIFKPGDRVLDALNGVGGPGANGNIKSITLVQLDKATSTTKLTHLNLEDYLKKGDLKPNRSLAPGDVLYIPDKKKVLGLGDAFSMMSGINLLRLVTGF